MWKRAQRSGTEEQKCHTSGIWGWTDTFLSQCSKAWLQKQVRCPVHIYIVLQYLANTWGKWTLNFLASDTVILYTTDHMEWKCFVHILYMHEWFLWAIQDHRLVPLMWNKKSQHDCVKCGRFFLFVRGSKTAAMSWNALMRYHSHNRTQ